MRSLYENLTCYTYGMAVMFFVILSILLYQKREQNSLIRFLYKVMVFWTIILLKDIVYLVDGFWTNLRVNHITTSIDMLCIPVFAVFLFEIVKPGWANMIKVIFMLLPTVVSVGIVIITDSIDVFRVLIFYSNIFAVVVAILVLYSVHFFNKYIKMNYSYTETISIYWLRTVVFLFMSILLIWSAIISTNMILAKSIYYLSLIAVFTYLYLRTMHHHVVPVPDNLNPFVHNMSNNNENETQVTTTETARIATKLVWSMEEQQMFLNPLLTLRKVAAAIGTNRTYLSEYLNQELKTNFYDYVNSYRIKEAEKLLLSDKNIKLEEVSERCGFNSLSTFQRSFAKVKGTTPAKFRAEYTTGRQF